MLRAASVVALAAVSLAGAATPLDLTSRRLSQTTGTFTFTGGDPGEGLDFIGDFVYAVDMSGPGGVPIGDAVFTSDGMTPGFTVSAQYSIAAWNDRPNFGSSSNDDALELLMHSIRWSGSPTPVTVTMEVEQGAFYRLQLLFYESGCSSCNRRGFDVSVDGMRIVDEYSPEIEQGGRTGTSRPGAAIYHEFVATSSTTTVTLDGSSASFGDTNPILDAVTLERLPGACGCPAGFPYQSTTLPELCYNMASYANAGIGPCGSWCTFDAAVGSGCGDNSGRICSEACPADFPYQSATLPELCYTDVSYANAGIGPCGSWCTFDAAVGSGCGDNSGRICSDACDLGDSSASGCADGAETETRTSFQVSGTMVTGLTGASGRCLDYVKFHYADGGSMMVGPGSGGTSTSQDIDPAVEYVSGLVQYEGCEGTAWEYLFGGIEFIVKSIATGATTRTISFAGDSKTASVRAEFNVEWPCRIIGFETSPGDASTVTGETVSGVLTDCAGVESTVVACGGPRDDDDDDDDSDDNSLVVILGVVIGVLLVVIAILVIMKRSKVAKAPHGRRGPATAEAATSPTAPQQPALASIKAEALGMMSEEPIAEPIAEAVPHGHVSGAEAAAMAEGEPPPQQSVGWGRRFAAWRAVAEPPPPPQAEFEPEC